MNLYVIGLGPGEKKQMTLWAREALDACTVLIGYQGYMDLIAADYLHKRQLATPMTREVERCRMALAEAAAGETVGIVCSGDAGVYGMAGLIYELAEEYPPMEIEIVPGVTAASSGAAVLGAPLMHDFAVISLSDLLTPWDKIENRLRAAAMADFVICLYNPASRKRAGHLARACEIIMEHQDGSTVCGYVRNIGREGEAAELTTLSGLAAAELDMFTTVFIGNTETCVINGRMVTPRGYRK